MINPAILRGDALSDQVAALETLIAYDEFADLAPIYDQKEAELSALAQRLNTDAAARQPHLATTFALIR